MIFITLLLLSSIPPEMVYPFSNKLRGIFSFLNLVLHKTPLLLFSAGTKKNFQIAYKSTSENFPSLHILNIYEYILRVHVVT